MEHFKAMLMTVWTAAAGTSGKDAAIGTTTAFLGLISTQLLGGWDKPLQVLMVLMVADYVSGVLMAIKEKRVNSDVMFWGGIRKITILFVVGLAALIDDWLKMDAPVFRTAALYFYAGREGLSVVENLGSMGVPLPGKLTDFLEQLNKKGEGNGG